MSTLLSGILPLTVAFTNQSVPTRTLISYLWDFGNGVTSTLQNPVHAYTGVGAYTVRLTANTERHRDTETKVGYVTVVPTSAVVITYTYDGLSRLTHATYSGASTATFAYAYDPAGNRTAYTQTVTDTLVTTYTYDAANRLATQNGQSLFTWDANGNLLADGNAVYAYDSANRLISTTLSGVNTQFGYNGDGIRLRQVEAGTSTTYTQDYAAPLPVVLQARTESAATQYVYSLGTRPLAEYEAAAWEYLLPDALGSVRQLADASAGVTLLKSYEPYGSVLNSQGSATSIFGYSGEQLDNNGLIYLRARYMQPGLGVFLSQDPWAGDVLQPGSMNGWNYGLGNPVQYTDPSGYCATYDTGCLAVRDEIEADFSGQVFIDVPDDDCNDQITAQNVFTDEPMPWQQQELEDVKQGLQLLRGFWGTSSFARLFAPVTIRRVYQGFYQSALTRYHDPVDRVNTPVILLDNDTFYRSRAHSSSSVSPGDRMGTLWGELYHVMDYYLSGAPSPQDFEFGGWLYEQGCKGQTVHSYRFAFAAGWTLEQCFAALEERTPNPVIDSPANLIGGPNYAGKGPHEDFAHTYQAVTMALIGGEELCISLYVTDLCIRSNITSSKVHAPDGFWIDYERLAFFLNDAKHYNAYIAGEWK